MSIYCLNITVTHIYDVVSKKKNSMEPSVHALGHQAVVFLKKFQGQELEPLASDDLAIGWTSSSQLRALADFGTNVVSMDSTHNTAGMTCIR